MGAFLKGLSWSKHFLVHINDLQTPSIYICVDASTIFEICNQDVVSVIQDSADIVEQWSVIMTCVLIRLRLKKW